MKWMGIDYGSVRVGIAMSDPDGLFAMPVQTIQRVTDKQVVSEILALIEDKEPDGVVVGLPYNMDGTEGEAVQKVRAFLNRLTPRLSIPVETWDERMSTQLVERLLIAADVRRDKRKHSRDKLAAQTILQGYLDATIQIKDRL